MSPAGVGGVGIKNIKKINMDIEIDMTMIIDEALKYPKIFEVRKIVDREILTSLLEGLDDWSW